MKQRHKWIEDWSDERDTEGRYFVTLIHGRAFEPSPCCASALHVRSFETVKEAMYAVRNSFECQCPRCTGIQCKAFPHQCVAAEAERSVI